MANLTNDVVDIKKNGAILIDDIANNKLIDELNCNGSVNESKLMFMAGVCAKTPDTHSSNNVKTIDIIIYQ